MRTTRWMDFTALLLLIMAALLPMLMQVTKGAPPVVAPPGISAPQMEAGQMMVCAWVLTSLVRG